MAKRYFDGGHANPDWQALESEEAKRLRGRGWYTFCKTIRAERGNRCEVCGALELTGEERNRLARAERQRRELHLHHLKKLRTHRQLRFERSNVVVCCQSCHKELEKQAIE